MWDLKCVAAETKWVMEDARISVGFGGTFSFLSSSESVVPRAGSSTARALSLRSEADVDLFGVSGTWYGSALAFAKVPVHLMMLLSFRDSIRVARTPGLAVRRSREAAIEGGSDIAY